MYTECTGTHVNVHAYYIHTYMVCVRVYHTHTLLPSTWYVGIRLCKTRVGLPLLDLGALLSTFLLSLLFDFPSAVARSTYLPPFSTVVFLRPSLCVKHSSTFTGVPRRSCHTVRLTWFPHDSKLMSTT